MKKIYLTLILGILLVGTATAGILMLEKIYTKEITTISSDLFCEKQLENSLTSNYEVSKECLDKKRNSEIDLTNSLIEIKQDPKTGVLRVRAK